MEWLLLGLLLLIALPAALILPWVHLFAIRSLRAEIAQLKRQLNGDAATPVYTPAPTPTSMPAAVTVPEPVASPWKKAESVPTPSPTPPIKPRVNFERQFGARLPVWVGGIALALAGLYLVKYSIEANLLSPEVRIWIGIIFGFALLAGGQYVRERTRLVDYARIAQALTGAGIADLYGCLYAATSVYHMLSPATGFALMAGVTLLALVLARRHGAPIALLGMLGGFLTPVMVGSPDPNVPLLYTYLYILSATVLYFIRRENWWWLAAPLMSAAFFWALIWIIFESSDSIWVGLFILALSVTFVRFSQDMVLAREEAKQNNWLNTTVLVAAIALLAGVTVKVDFTMLHWGLIGLLSVLGMVIARQHPKLYGFVPWVTMGVTAVLLCLWEFPKEYAVLCVLNAALFSLLYMVGGYLMMWNARKPTLWALLSTLTPLVYYAVAYFKLHELFFRHPPLPHGWGIVASMLGVCAALVTFDLLRRYTDNERVKQELLAVFTGTAVAFISIAISMEIIRDFLPIAFAAEILVVSWMASRFAITALPKLAFALAIVFAVLLLPQIALLMELAAYSVGEIEMGLQPNVPLVNDPLLQLGVPAILFALASIQLRRVRDSRLVAAFELAAIALVATMGYYLARHAFHNASDVLYVKAGFFERGVITNILFAYGVACMWFGLQQSRDAIARAGLLLSGLALFRIFYFDLIAYNPVFAHQDVGDTLLFNRLVITYALPFLWLYVTDRALARMPFPGIRKATPIIGLILLFSFITLEVRQYFHGAFLDTGPVTNTEIYSYSVAWLLMGIALLGFGTYKGAKTIRIASLAVMILTVGKVFLYDASELTGLLRVFSFLGLGLSLLGLSWFYTRYVFRER